MLYLALLAAALTAMLAAWDATTGTCRPVACAAGRTHFLRKPAAMPGFVASGRGRWLARGYPPPLLLGS